MMTMMTMMNNIFAYLNQFDPPKIRPLVEPIVMDMKNPALSEAQLDAKIRMALEKSQYPFIPFENAEIKIYGALAKFNRQRYYDTKVLLEEALAKFDQDPHRKAITLWLLGINAAAMEDNSQTFQYWYKVRETINDLSKGKMLLSQRPDIINWYKDRLKEINRLLASTCIQEVFAWLDAHEIGHLDDQMREFYRKIQESISQRKYHEAHQLIESCQRLAEMGSDHDQMREVLVYCGVSKFQLGSTEEAIKYFTKAISLLPPGSHRQAVTYWLLGGAQWRVPRLREDAMINLKEAIVLFKELRMDADRKHNPSLMKWYDEKLVYMQEDLNSKVKSLLNS